MKRIVSIFLALTLVFSVVGCADHVNLEEGQRVEITEISLLANTNRVAIGGNIHVTPTYTLSVEELEEEDKEAYLNSLESVWESSDPGIATVTKDGTVSGVKEGECTITHIKGNKSTQAKITVCPKPTDFSLEDIEMKLGDDPVDIPITYVPENAKITSMMINSSDASVATIKNKKIEALKAGKAVLTITIEGIEHSMNVVVFEASEK